MNLAGPLYALLAFALYATHDVIIKFLGGTYSPFQLIFFSTLFSFRALCLRVISKVESSKVASSGFERGSEHCFLEDSGFECLR